MRLWFVRFAELTVRIGTRGVEVAQGHVLHAVGDFGVHEHALHDEFRAPIGADRVLWVVLS